MRFRLDHLVCEVPTLGMVDGFRWYELDGDSQTFDPPRYRPGYNVIVATRRPTQSALLLLERLRGSGVSHLLFEADDLSASRQVVRDASRIGIGAIATRHLADLPESTDLLLAAADDLRRLNPQFVKLAFPAVEEHTVRIGLDALDRWRSGWPPLCITPMGTRQGRVAAALAGSRLVFAPMVEHDDRPSADWFRTLAT